MMRSRWQLAAPVLPVLLVLLLPACGSAGEESASSGDVAGACLEGATECDDMGGDIGAPPPDAPVSDEPISGGDAGGAEAVEPQDGLVDLRPVGWEEVQVDADDQSRVTVHWTSGVQECHALAEVEVEYGDDAITLTVVEGTPPSDEPMACIELAVRKQTTVQLEEEVGPRSIRDGADT